ncbi:MAG: alpha-hydroxy acid oxidase [Legionellaceae bacterium]|nr:alpha-hydroxy acid oxidase [Legionellaceae bacterium]
MLLMTGNSIQMNPINTNEFETAAQQKLNIPIYDYIASGAGDEYTLKRNTTSFEHIQIIPRLFGSTSTVTTEIELFQQFLSQPVFVSPMAFHSLVNPLGETTTVAAINEIGIGMTVSTLSSVSLEDVATAATCPLWFQLYIYKDRAITQELIRRAERAGYSALVVTVDTPIMGKRERDISNQFKLPDGVSAKNLVNQQLDLICSDKAGSNVKNYTDDLFDRTLTWKDMEWIQSETKLPVILKGVMHEDDAAMALNLNVSAIIISNHGGRQLDGMPATIEVLPEIAKRVAKKIPILIDGGFRRGTDIFKAIALGADCIMVGRPVLWALACNGKDGIKRLFDIYHTELIEAMILCGCSTIEDVTKYGRNMMRFSK